MTAKTKRASDPANSIQGILLQYIKSLLIGAASALLLLMAGAAAAYSTADPTKLLQPLGLASLYLSAAVCGFCAARQSETPLLAGFPAGLLYMLLITALSFIPLDTLRNTVSVIYDLLLHAGIIAASVTGAWIGRKRMAKPSAKHKKYRR